MVAKTKNYSSNVVGSSLVTTEGGNTRSIPHHGRDPHRGMDSHRGRNPQEELANLAFESLKSVVENYVKYYASGDGHTARAKRYDLQHFLSYLASFSGNVESVSVSDWTLQRTKDFVDYRLSMGEAPSTVGRRLATIKHFGRTLAERVPGYINPAREVKSPRVDPTRPHGLNALEVALLRQAARLCVEERHDKFAAKRDAFLLELLLATGLRADEVRLLVMAQISDDHEWLKNVKTKGRKFRNVYLDSSIRPQLDIYLEERNEVLLSHIHSPNALPFDPKRLPVFLSFRQANPRDPLSFGLSPKTIWRAISRFGERARALSEGHIGNLHPHKLRHTFAHGLLDSSKDVRLVAQALGHSDVRTTMRYTERTQEEVARAIETKVKGESS